MRKTVAAAAMAASLTLGGATGVALFSPTVSGAQSDQADPSTTGDERPARDGRLAELLAPLVEDGTITQAQADAVVARLAEARPQHPGGALRVDIIAAASEALGVEPGALRERLAAGASLADVATAEGVEVEALQDALVAAHRARVDEAVAAGDITREQADQRARLFADRVDDLVRRAFDGGHGGPGRHGMDSGAGGGFAPDDHHADDTTDS